MPENTEQKTIKSKTDTIKIKDNPEKVNNTKHSKTKLPWFSRFLQHSARKRRGLILQCSRAHTELLALGPRGHIPAMPLLYWVATLDKLFTHIAFSVFSSPRNWDTKGEYCDWTDFAI